MKKINILPLAEKEIDYSLLMAQAGKKSGITVPGIVILILFAVMIVFAFINPFITILLSLSCFSEQVSF